MTTDRTILRIFRSTMYTLRAFLLPALLVLFAVSATVPPAAEAAYGSITYVRFDWILQSDRTYNINVVYCMNSATHGITWGENAPSSWSLTRAYPALNGCVTRLLFAKVVVNDYLHASLYTNPTPGDSDSEAIFSLNRRSAGFYCNLQSNYRNALKPVPGRPCAWTT